MNGNTNTSALYTSKHFIKTYQNNYLKTCILFRRLSKLVLKMNQIKPKSN